MHYRSQKWCFLCFYALFLRLSAQIGADPDECKVSRCSPDGPVVRFPFRLKDQPFGCGYPGFEISCTEKKQTMLELPYSVKFSVDKINYKSREIVLHDQDFCLQRQLQNLTLSPSPFKFYSDSLHDYTFLNCSSSKKEYPYWFLSLPCSFVSINPVYFLRSDTDLDNNLDLSSCNKTFDISLPDDIFYGSNFVSLTWSESLCGYCEKAGEKCRLKGSGPETECIPKGVKGKILVAGTILGSFVLVCVIILLYRAYRSYESKTQNIRRIEKFLEDYKTLKPSRYSYNDIKKLTNHFKDKLGQGAYGTVYGGKLSNEVLVAVKVLTDSTGNGEEFINEVSTIGRIHHVNVVRLVGFCADKVKRALVYEFLPNGSLEKFIFAKSRKSHPLGWEKLHSIATGIAKGIEYLHQGCDQRILHFDIKPNNILLDETFNPKISDFGLAKLCSKDQSAVSMTVARGTMGYIAPEVLSRNFGNASYKSDVYSYGMLLLEMVGGRKNIDVESDQVYFPQWVYSQLDEGEDVCIRIEEEGDDKIAKKLAIVGLWCVQWHPIDRPSMKKVVQMLEREGEDLTMPPNPFASLGSRRQGPPRTAIQQELTTIPEEH